MALLSMRKFAKVTGISYYNIKKYIEEGVIVADENGMIESSENIKILKRELREGVKHYAIFFVPSLAAKEGVKKLMEKENVIEVKNYDSICLEYNRVLQEKAVEISESISRKYKEEVLEEFVKRYSGCLQRQLCAMSKKKEFSKLPYQVIHDFLAFGIFPEGYEYLKGADINAYVTQGIERFLIKHNNLMEEKFNKICEDLLLYWDSTDDKTVLTRADITPEFLYELKHSQLCRSILYKRKSFKIGIDLEHPTPIFEDLRSRCKTAFKPTVLAEFSKKRFYHIIDIHKDMNPDECTHIIYDLRASDNVECFVCCTKDMEEAYIPESVLIYLDCMQRERKESVIYIDSVESKTRNIPKSGVASTDIRKEPDSVIVQDKIDIRQKAVSEAKSSTERQEPVSKVDLSNAKHESNSGVAAPPEPVEPVSAQSEVELIPSSSVEIVSDEESARDSIKSLLGSLG